MYAGNVTKHKKKQDTVSQKQQKRQETDVHWILKLPDRVYEATMLIMSRCIKDTIENIGNEQINTMQNYANLKYK